MSGHLRSLMVKKDEPYLFSVIKDAGGRMARDERIFKSPIVLEVCQKTMDIYILEKY
jgi:hypothetical protein